MLTLPEIRLSESHDVTGDYVNLSFSSNVNGFLFPSRQLVFEEKEVEEKLVLQNTRLLPSDEH